VNVSAEEVGSVLGCYLKHPFRYYAGSTSKYKEVRLPFYYRVLRDQGNFVFYICLPGKVNPSYNLLELWHYNKFNRLLLSQNMQEVLSSGGGHTFVDVVNGKVRNMSAFSYVDRDEDDVERETEAGEVQGA
jgi:hypothetical protein